MPWSPSRCRESAATASARYCSTKKVGGAVIAVGLGNMCSRPRYVQWVPLVLDMALVCTVGIVDMYSGPH